MHGRYQTRLSQLIAGWCLRFEPWPLPATLQLLTSRQPHRHLAGRLHFASQTMFNRQMHGYGALYSGGRKPLKLRLETLGLRYISTGGT